jgi:hypothetical protein
MIARLPKTDRDERGMLMHVKLTDDGMIEIYDGTTLVTDHPVDDSSQIPWCRECLEEGHMVEPDGHCPHDRPSVLLRLGMI